MRPEQRTRTSAWVLAGLASGAIAFATVGRTEQEATPKPSTNGQEARPADDLDSPDALRTHRDRRLTAAKRWIEMQRQLQEVVNIPTSQFVESSRRLMLTEMSVAADQPQRLAAARSHVDRLAELVELSKADQQNGNITVIGVREAELAYEEAVCQYLELRRGEGDEVAALRKRVEVLERRLDEVAKGAAR